MLFPAVTELGEPVMAIPASALTSLNGQPAVWLVDPEKLTVSLHNVQTARFDADTVIVEHGIDIGRRQAGTEFVDQRVIGGKVQRLAKQCRLVAYQMDDHQLLQHVPGLKKTSLDDGIRKTIEMFERERAAKA